MARAQIFVADNGLITSVLHNMGAHVLIYLALSNILIFSGLSATRHESLATRTECVISMVHNLASVEVTPNPQKPIHPHGHRHSQRHDQRQRNA